MKALGKEVGSQVEVEVWNIILEKLPSEIVDTVALIAYEELPKLKEISTKTIQQVSMKYLSLKNDRLKEEFINRFLEDLTKGRL